ncbi:MAG: HlyD family efflux transporter periplasmic adaptor subunit [Cyclobacteriaceae bacterium]
MKDLYERFIGNTVSSSELYSLRSLKTPAAGKILAKWLMVLFGIVFVALFLPWQQNIRGTGKVTAFNPENRPQTVETTIAGRIAKWNVREGQFVSKGDTILRLSEVKDKYFDPMLLTRLKEQIDAKIGSIESKRSKVEALTKRIVALKNSLEVKRLQTQNKISQTQFKLTSDSVDFEAEKVRFSNLENQYDRNKSLYDAGNIALTKLQDIQSKFQEGRMKIISAENKFLESKTELLNAKYDVAGVEAEYADKISKAESELNSTLSELYDAQGDLAKTNNEYANMQIRNEQYNVLAPQSGYIVKAMKGGIGETIKEGEAVATIMPDSPDLAIEMYIKAMDVPLIATGRKVRIQFDGWPALQFSGWPSVSVGTFGGTVAVIDKTNGGSGDFRILARPDSEDEEWPEQLRLGSGIKGWVMLDTVPLWYELWRQLNGFPPTLYEAPLQDIKDKISKK